MRRIVQPGLATFGMAFILGLFLAGCGPGSTNGTTPAPPTLTIGAGASPSPAVRLPAVLVHGWKGSLLGGAFSGCPEDYKNYVPPTPVSETEDFNDLGLELRDKYGFRVYYARLLSSPCYTPPVDANVPAVMEAIDRARAETGEVKVVVIAHSMGGLVSRAYLESSKYRGDVAEFFTFGTPHDGIDISSNWLAILLAPKAMDIYDYLGKQEVMQDFKRGAMSRYAERRIGVKYHLIGGDLPVNARTPLGGLTYLVSGGIPGDGLVATVSSARLAGDVDFSQPPEAHSVGLGAPDYFSRGSKARQCIVDALVMGKNCGIRTGSSQGPGAGQASAAVRPLCKATEFATLLAKYDVGPHMPDALREYTKDCYGRGMTAFDLAQEAVKAGLQIRLLSIESKRATGFVTDASGRKSGVLPGGQVVEEIPGSRALALPDAIYVFYPPADVASEVRGTGVGVADVRLVRGSNPAVAEVITYGPVDVTPQTLLRVSPGPGSILTIDNNGDGKVEMEKAPNDKKEVRPRQP